MSQVDLMFLPATTSELKVVNLRVYIRQTSYDFVYESLEWLGYTPQSEWHPNKFE